VSESSTGRSAEKALGVVAAALNAIDEELQRRREGRGSVSNVEQLVAFRKELVHWYQLLESNALPNKDARRPGMSRVIVDSWPFDSALGQLLISAEKAYMEAWGA
jgi:hypothetical protein